MIRKTILGCALASLPMASAPVRAQDITPADVTAPPAPVDVKKEGSFYLQCDGNPNNMAAGESVARFLGAVTLLGVFAPSPESPNPAKRKFGEAGVKACDGILSGEKAEGNVTRRIPLILARALHHIEARNYKAAMADVGVARDEAKTAGLIGNSYFDRSMGMSLDLIEAAARLRAGDVEGGQALTLRPAAGLQYSYYPLLVPRYAPGLSSPQLPAALDRERHLARFLLENAAVLAFMQGMDGHFTEAAETMETYIKVNASIDTKGSANSARSVAAVYYALGGEWQKGAALAKSARDDLETRKQEGRPETNEAQVVEMLDLYDITVMAHEGRMKEARRNFAARSSWTYPHLGQTLEINRRLRQGALPDELFGSLAPTPEQMAARDRDETKARMLEMDKNNRTLFTLILPYAPIKDYERISNEVWNPRSRRFIAKEPDAKLHAYFIVANSEPLTQPDVLMLHSAVQAKARGKAGFMLIKSSARPSMGWVRFGNRGDADMIDAMYLDADAVMAELRPIIPTPQDLQARQAAATKKL